MLSLRLSLLLALLTRALLCSEKCDLDENVDELLRDSLDLLLLSVPARLAGIEASAKALLFVLLLLLLSLLFMCIASCLSV